MSVCVHQNNILFSSSQQAAGLIGPRVVGEPGMMFVVGKLSTNEKLLLRFVQICTSTVPACGVAPGAFTRVVAATAI